MKGAFAFIVQLLQDMNEMLKITPSCNTDQGVQRICESLRNETLNGVRKLNEVGLP